MEIKVRDLGEVESKSTQQIEQELLEKHEAEVSGETPTQEEVKEPAEEPTGLSEDDVRAFLSNRYGREINSLDELAEARESEPELPEDVAAYYKYKQETGRGLEDFMKVNRNLDEADGDGLLKEYLLITEDGLDEEDVEMMMEEYKFDEDLDDEVDIKKAKLAKKKAVAKAKKFFEEQKENTKHLLSQGAQVLWRTPKSIKLTSNMLNRRRLTKRSRSAGRSGLTIRPTRCSVNSSKALSSTSTINPTSILPVTVAN